MAAKRISVTCPDCGEVRFLRPVDAKKVKRCRRCHLKSIAPLGWAATKAKYGEKIAVKHVQAYRLANPSSLEQKVTDTLDNLGVYYEREYWLQSTSGSVYLVDFVVFQSGQDIAIEVNGEYVHQFHTERDRRKRSLLRRRGYAVVELGDAQVNNGLAQHLAGVLGVAHGG